MTAIAGVVGANRAVYIGGDSAGTGDNYSMSVRSEPKVFVSEGFIYGFTSSFRMGQILRHQAAKAIAQDHGS